MKKFRKSFLSVLMLFTVIASLNAQVGVGTNSPDASAQLEVSSSSKGLLLPRLTTSQIDGITNAAAGLLVFNSTTSKFVGCVASATSAGTVSNISPSNPSYYMGISNSSSPMVTVTDVGQTFPVSTPTRLNSIALWFVSMSSAASIKVSLYTGNTLGGGTLLSSSTQNVSASGQKEFTFATPVYLSPGNYYFLVHIETLEINGGLRFCSAQYSTGNFFQGQSVNGSAFSYNTSTDSLYFVFTHASGGPVWTDLH